MFLMGWGGGNGDSPARLPTSALAGYLSAVARMHRTRLARVCSRQPTYRRARTTCCASSEAYLRAHVLAFHHRGLIKTADARV